VQRIQGRKVDILAWTDPGGIEGVALDQLKNISSLPWVFHHVAAMPDVHYGKGATVGSVIAMKGAVSPAAVGVDIGCFPGDTAVPLADGRDHALADLAARGGEHIVYACRPSGRVVMARATAKKTRRNARLVRVTLDNSQTVRCTADHEFMLRDGTFRRADQLAPGDSLMPLYAQRDRDGYTLIQQNYSGRWQKAHWIAARSGLLGPVLRYEGQRTIIHHRNLDEANNSPSNLQFMGANDHAALHRSTVERNGYWQSKEFERRRVAALAQKGATADGHAYYAARGTANILEYMQQRRDHFRAAVAGNGRRGAKFLMTYNTSEKGRAKSRELASALYPCETCGERVKSHIGLHNHKRYRHGYNHKVISVEPLAEREDVFCLTVPEYANFALSAGVFVHNCGMAAVRTSLSAQNLPDSLHGLRSELERAIPVGFHEHRDPIDRPGDKRFWEEFHQLTPAVKDLFGKARKQLGTLGGGNHFIELCLDTDERVWMMLHSGSRNIGKSLAEIHIGRAKKLAHNRDLPDRDLAVFLAGTSEMEEYRRDLFWAQRYAMKNREAMLDLYGAVLRRFRPEVQFGEAVLCHHNYVAEETHFGEEVLVTRKGAIRAGKGELGIIPGSMGTRSYIVRGLGNPASFESASHGAGRRMSRGEAKRRFTVRDLIDQTQGVECRKDGGVLDEIPSAYKPIEQVMENQKDLVESIAELRQVLCVKG
jgi:tRNA-splicing ligase RtcB